MKTITNGKLGVVKNLKNPAFIVRDGKVVNNPFSAANLAMMGMLPEVASCSTEANMIMDGLENVKTKAIDLTDKRDLMFL